MPMKKLLLIILCGAMLLDGCYSYSVLETGDKEQQLPPDSESIIVTLKNGSVIESEAFHHVVVNVPSNFIYGIGASLNASRWKVFIGRIDPSLIDSSGERSYDGRRYKMFWFKDNSQIRFFKEYYFAVTPDQGTGLWCIGGKSDGESDSMFAGKVVLGNVQTIEIENISVGKSVGMGAILGAAAGLLSAAVTDTGSPEYRGLNLIAGPLGGVFVGLLLGTIVAAVL